MNEAIAAALILLTAPDGHKVLINPEQVVSLHSRKLDREYSTMFVPGAECLLNMADGKFVLTVEPCSVVQQAMERQQ